MTTDLDQNSGTITRHDRPERSTLRENDVCEGCRELAVRVDRLEQALANRTDSLEPLELGTTSCYWVCIGVHALCAFLMYASEALMQFGMMLSIGSIGTLVVCQVFSTRPIHQRALRSLLSVSAVAAAALLGLWLGDVAEPQDALPFLVMLFPPVLASGWIVAKIFVWWGGWRIVPPGHSSKYARLQIQHLLLCTLLFATYLAASRMMMDEIESWTGGDFIVTMGYLVIPTITCTFISCLLARVMLGVPANRVILRLVLLAVYAMTFMTMACAVLIALVGELTADWEILLAVMVYALPLSVGVFVSSGGTFAMMRIANYRFLSRND